MIKVGIVGISGYSGGELLKILLNHPHVRLTYVSANNTQGKISDIWPQLKGRTTLYCEKFNVAKAVQSCELVFLAVPHTISMTIAPKLLKRNIKVIDLSGDYRLKNSALYKKWYGKTHADTTHLSKAVYGLPELYREKIKKAKLVANPGCYPTAALLGLSPLISTKTTDILSIIIDAKSGTTGAGKKLSPGLHFSEANENFKAYKVCHHQHTPEINQYLSRVAGKQVGVTFVPHLLPINRGILETMYIPVSKRLSVQRLHSIYAKFYKREPFIRLLPLGTQPELKNVAHNNFCDIGLAFDKAKNVVVITAAIDNLMKGAASQAVQNMNIMCHFNEKEGLLT